MSLPNNFNFRFDFNEQSLFIYLNKSFENIKGTKLNMNINIIDTLEINDSKKFFNFKLDSEVKIDKLSEYIMFYIGYVCKMPDDKHHKYFTKILYNSYSKLLNNK